MTTRPIDYQVRLRTLADLEDFCKYIKDAMVTHISLTERFTGLRLAGTKLEYNDWLHSSKYGVAHSKADRIEIGNTTAALQVAGTVIHELAHMMVGPSHSHNENWHEACKALGLLNERPHYEVSDFTEATLKVIANAIEMFAREHPTLVYHPVEIPWPSGVGLWSCTNEHESYLSCHDTTGKMVHWCHILQYQDEDIRWMLENEHNILNANEMGTGKTPETMGYINVAYPKKILVVCPNNAKLVWKRHFEKMCIHKYEIELAAVQLYMMTGDVTIISYEGAARWADALKAQEWDLAIFDEGHNIKNPSAQRSRACYGVQKTKKRMIITGSPIKNYPIEIFPLAHYLHREAYPEVSRFEARFGGRGKSRFGHNLNRLNSELRATIMLRRFKKDVLPQLPKKRRHVIQLEVPPAIRKLIDEEMELWNSTQADVGAAEAQFLASLKNDSENGADNETDWAALIEQLRVSKKYAFERMAEIAHIIGRAKVPFVIEMIEAALEEKEKLIVFGHHRDVLTEIANKFRPMSVLLLGGNANQAQASMDAGEKFSEDENCRLFVGGISLASAYSLRGSSTVIFIEQGWVPGDFSQAEDRAHGVGRGDAEAKSMLIQHIVFEDSLDTIKARLVVRKQKSIDKATGKV